MAYILNARSIPGELTRIVWMEPTGVGDGVRITVANGVATLASGVGQADELERLASGSASYVCSGDLWLERTESAKSWNLFFANVENLNAVEISSFEFACALQRVQAERLRLEAAGRYSELWTMEEIATTRGIAFDS